MTCEPLVVDEKLYVAEPLESASEEVSVVPSTSMVRLPVGVAVVELEPDATVIVIVSLAPEAGVELAAANVVSDAASEEAVDVCQLVNRLYRSIEPKPEASSYPVVAGYSDSPALEQ